MKSFAECIPKSLLAHIEEKTRAAIESVELPPEPIPTTDPIYQDIAGRKLSDNNNKSAFIIYYPGLKAVFTTFSSSLLFVRLVNLMQLKLKHNYVDDLYKFIEPCKHESYIKGDSLCEELGCSKDEFLTARKGVVTHYSTQQEYTQASEAGDAFKGKPFCSYVNRRLRLTFYKANYELINEIIMNNIPSQQIKALSLNNVKKDPPTKAGMPTSSTDLPDATKAGMPTSSTPTKAGMSLSAKAGMSLSNSLTEITQRKQNTEITDIDHAEKIRRDRPPELSTAPQPDLLTKSKRKKKDNLELADFDKFWALYPRTEGKKMAKKAYEKAIKLTNNETLMKAVEAQIKYRQAKDPNWLEFYPHASTWLNQSRWEDVIVTQALAFTDAPPPRPIRTFPTPEQNAGWWKSLSDDAKRIWYAKQPERERDLTDAMLKNLGINICDAKFIGSPPYHDMMQLLGREPR